MNKQISAPEVRLIDETGKMIGIVSRDEALAKADEIGLDLVEISPTAAPPVCKIIDFGKFRYEEKRNLQKAKKKQKVIETKEIRLRPAIGEHDLIVKANHIREFIEKGKKVKVTMKFKGREIAYFNIGREVFDKLIARVSDIADLEAPVKTERALILVTLVEKAEKVAAEKASKAGV